MRGAVLQLFGGIGDPRRPGGEGEREGYGELAGGEVGGLRGWDWLAEGQGARGSDKPALEGAHPQHRCEPKGRGPLSCSPDVPERGCGATLGAPLRSPGSGVRCPSASSSQAPCRLARRWLWVHRAL